jgi:hypothetical protein
MPPGQVLHKMADIFNSTIEYIVQGDEASLMRLLREKEAESQKLQGGVDALDEQFRNKFFAQLGISPPDNISAFIDTSNYLKTLGIDLMKVLRSKTNNVAPLDLVVMTEVIIGIEEVFEKYELRLPPKKKARLITLLYEEMFEKRTDRAVFDEKVISIARALAV